MTPSAVPITFFTDFTCPFCYVMEAALERISTRRSLDVRPKSFELYPSPAPLPAAPETEADIETAQPLAREIGVELRPPPLRPRTRKAHEAWHLARSLGVGREMRRAIYRAYWRDGEDIGRIDVLMRLTGEVGMEPTDLKIALDLDAHRESVLAELELARRLRVVQVPTLFVGSGPDARILQGARSLSALDDTLAAG